MKTYYLVTISQSKKGHIYLVITKKEIDFEVRSNTVCIQKYSEIALVCLIGTVNKVAFYLIINFFDFKVLKQCFSYQFLAISMSIGKYFRFLQFTFSTYFSEFSKLFNSDKRRFRFLDEFSTKFVLVKDKMFSSCFNCVIHVENIVLENLLKIF